MLVPRLCTFFGEQIQGGVRRFVYFCAKFIAEGAINERKNKQIDHASLGDAVKKCTKSRVLRAIIFFCVFSSFLPELTPETLGRRIQAHLLIGDTVAAVNEAQQGLEHSSDHPLIYEWAIKSFAAAGKEVEMLAVWEEMNGRFPELSFDQDLLEHMCWGILKKGERAPGLASQLICLIGAALGSDMKAVPFLLHGLHSSNAQLRAMAVELSAHYGDYPLKSEICQMFREESVLEVRLKVIQAIGQLQIEEHFADLVQCVASPKTGPREKLAAIEAIVAMRKRINKEELNLLASSKRAGLRQLACEVIAHCDLKEEFELLIPLIEDSHPEVCAAAIRTWGLLRKPITDSIKKLAFSSLDPHVGVAASWVWLIDLPQEAEIAMVKWLEHSHAHVRALAASAVAAAGPHGIALAKRLLEDSLDPYVRVNLAIGLARQREECEKTCRVIEDGLKNSTDKWMFSEEGGFKMLEKSTLSHNPLIPNFPEVMNQTVRLELFNLLAILEAPGALDAIKAFLKQRHWGVTGLAAETLLGEGDESAIALVRELLCDPDYHMRVEAALVLATWGKDHSALPTLLEAYSTADRQMRLKILESLGHIGDKAAFPFLLERLQEPSLMIRMVAACVLIQTLNH
jgi:HEAT repeat protein